MNSPKLNPFKPNVTNKVCDIDLLKFSAVSYAVNQCKRGFLCLKKLTFAFSSARFLLLRFVAKRHMP